MSGTYRITVRGEMSERFCQGFPGLRRETAPGRTILRGDPPVAPPLPEVLGALGNLGLEVVGVDEPRGATAHTTLEG